MTGLSRHPAHCHWTRGTASVLPNKRLRYHCCSHKHPWRPWGHYSQRTSQFLVSREGAGVETGHVLWVTYFPFAQCQAPHCTEKEPKVTEHPLALQARVIRTAHPTVCGLSNIQTSAWSPHPVPGKATFVSSSALLLLLPSWQGLETAVEVESRDNGLSHKGKILGPEAQVWEKVFQVTYLQVQFLQSCDRLFPLL